MEAVDESRACLDDPAGAMTMAQPAHDPSRYSYYVDDALYSELIADFETLRQDGPTIEDSAERDLFRGLVEREARLLDRLQFKPWLQFYADECLYWVPSTPHGGDPRREIAVMFDDRRRLEDRVFRLSTGFAWSQAPSSRTMRLVSNVEVFASDNPDQRLVRSNFLISEFWDDETRTLAGWAGHRFRKIGGDWKISAKQVNLLVCDQSIRNPSIIL
jgi:3-phenylpropionate/cinnamic acid dioxygenase small subunit